MYNADDETATVTNCTFTGNTADANGGGMLNDINSIVTVTNCSFDNNTTAGRGGAMLNWQCSPTMSGCTFSDNVAENGGAINNWTNASPTVTDCTFSNNTAVNGGGMLNEPPGSMPTVADSEFCGNIPVHIDGHVVLHGQIDMSTFCPIPVCPADANGDGVVSVLDFLALLAAWGACP
jgi:hypothetical protein